MAGYQRDNRGVALIQFKGLDGKRKTLRIGKLSDRNASRFAEKFEALLQTVGSGQAPDDELLAWAAKLGDDVNEKLTAFGLLPKREKVSLGQLIEDFIAQHPTKKPRTKEIMQQAQRNLLTCFGYDKPLRELTAADGDDFRAFLIRPKKDGGAGLSENTAGRRAKHAKQFLRSAVRRGLIRANPFEEIGGMVRGNKARMYFVTVEEAAKVLEACPDLEWKLLFALARFGGLRTPSEHRGLRYSDIDWAGNKFLVHSPKTEHHAGGDCRWVPIFPELRPYLLAACEAMEPGQEYLLQRYRNQVNLGTRFKKIIKRAGLIPWPKSFQNLRSTRQTELTKKFPLHVVCAWLGNKAAVAAEHYLQLTDADFENAAKESAAPALQTGNNLPLPKTTGPITLAANVAANCDQSSSVLVAQYTRQDSHPGAVSSENTSIPPASAALALHYASGSSCGGDEQPADLAAVVAAWPTLPKSTRLAIVALLPEGNA